MVRRLGLGKNNHLTYASLALNPRYAVGRGASNEYPQHMFCGEIRKILCGYPLLSVAVYNNDNTDSNKG